MECQAFAFWIREGDREDRDREERKKEK